MSALDVRVFARIVLKKGVVLLFSILIFSPAAFFSCKNSNETALVYANVETLKDEISKREQKMSWTNELEGSRLSDDIKFAENKATLNVENDTLALAVLNVNAAVYPEFENFGSLDASSLNRDVYSQIEGFCLAVSENIYDGPEAFFDSQYLFNYVFFREELKDGWQKNFKKDFPHLIDYNREEGEKKSDENEETGEPQKKVQEEKLFTKQVLGKPFENEEIIEIPIRFYCKYGSIDVTLYLDAKKTNSIYLAKIDKWNVAARR